MDAVQEKTAEQLHHPVVGCCLVNPSIIERGEIRSEPTRLRQRCCAGGWQPAFNALSARCSPGLCGLAVVRHAATTRVTYPAVVPGVVPRRPSNLRDCRTLPNLQRLCRPCVLAKGTNGRKPHCNALRCRTSSVTTAVVPLGAYDWPLPSPRCASVIAS